MSGDDHGTTGELDLDAIEARARAVQPPGRPLEEGALHWVAGTSLGRGIGDRSGSVVAYSIEGTEAREHIAGMDPATTLALVAEVRRLRADDAMLRERLAQWQAAYAEDIGKPRERARGYTLP